MPRGRLFPRPSPRPPPPPFPLPPFPLPPPSLPRGSQSLTDTANLEVSRYRPLVLIWKCGRIMVQMRNRNPGFDAGGRDLTVIHLGSVPVP